MPSWSTAKVATVVRLNRGDDVGEEDKGTPLEIALCRECGQHYYVGQGTRRAG